MLKLGYPGGPIIEKKALLGNSSAHRFPRAFLEKDSLDFSFSGLKTSVRNMIAKRDEGKGLTLSDEDISASFQIEVSFSFSSSFWFWKRFYICCSYVYIASVLNIFGNLIQNSHQHFHIGDGSMPVLCVYLKSFGKDPL